MKRRQSITEHLGRKAAAFVIGQRRVEDGIIQDLQKTVEDLWARFEQRMRALRGPAPLELVLYHFEASWEVSQALREKMPELVRRLQELGQVYVQVMADEILRWRPDLNREVTRAEEEAFETMGRPGAGMLTGVVAGHWFGDTVERIFERLGLKVEKEIRERWGQAFHEALMQGLSPARAAAEAFARAGIDLSELRRSLSEEAYQFERAVRTHAMASVNAAQHLFCRQLHEQGIAVGERWVATPDLLTCPECAQLDGQVWYFEGNPPISERPSLPRHPNCRCTIVPVISPAYDPEPARLFTYEEWFAGLPPEIQREILGEKGYELWRQGARLSAVLGTARFAEALERVSALLLSEPPPGPNFSALWPAPEVARRREEGKSPRFLEILNQVATVAQQYMRALLAVFPRFDVRERTRARTEIQTVAPPRIGYSGAFYPEEGTTKIILEPELRNAAWLRRHNLIPRDREGRALYAEELNNPYLRVAQTIRHEMAHAYHLTLFPRGTARSLEEAARYAALLLDAPEEEVRTAWEQIQRFLQNREELKARVSLYATVNVYEAFAETVALYTSPYYRGELPKEVEQALDTIFGGRARIEYIRRLTKALARAPIPRDFVDILGG